VLEKPPASPPLHKCLNPHGTDFPRDISPPTPHRTALLEAVFPPPPTPSTPATRPPATAEVLLLPLYSPSPPRRRPLHRTGVELAGTEARSDSPRRRRTARTRPPRSEFNFLLVDVPVGAGPASPRATRSESRLASRGFLGLRNAGEMFRFRGANRGAVSIPRPRGGFDSEVEGRAAGSRMASRALALVRVPRLRRVSATFRAERAAIRGFFRRFLAGFGPCEGCFGRDFACGVLGLRCRSERGISNWANAAGSGVSPGAGTDGDGSRGVGLPSRSGRFPCGFGSRSRFIELVVVPFCASSSLFWSF
jgi:hypothetical protein